MVDKKLSQFDEVSTGDVSYFPVLDRNTKNAKIAGTKAMPWTNCITEIPQDIKLELVDGTLTLKAGSVLYEPSGVGNFIKHTTTQDYTWAWGSGQFIIIAQKSGNIGQTTLLSKVYSGTAAPSNSSAGDVWYDTTNNIIKRYHSTDGWVSSNFCLPIAIVTSANSTVTSIDQVFNGFGYIGSTIFALPGVKGLIPNGRNEDGTLKNTPFTISSVKTSELYVNNTNVYISAASFGWGYSYDEDSNKVYYLDKTATRFFAYLGTYKKETNGRITVFSPRTPFHAVDYNDFKKLDDEAVKKRGDQDIEGVKNFLTEYGVKMKLPVLTKQNNDREGGQIFFEGADNDPLKEMYIDRNYGKFRFIGNLQDGSYIIPFEIDAANVTVRAPTNVPATDNSGNVVTTAWFNNKIKVVSALPANPVNGVFYFITD